MNFRFYTYYLENGESHLCLLDHAHKIAKEKGTQVKIRIMPVRYDLQTVWYVDLLKGQFWVNDNILDDSESAHLYAQSILA